MENIDTGIKYAFLLIWMCNTESGVEDQRG